MKKPVVPTAIVIENSAANLKGSSLDLSCGLGGEIVQISRSSALTGKGSANFFGTMAREGGGVTTCAAALGVDRAFT
jgi:hypothetical protein